MTSKILLIDIGNTRTKWALVDQRDDWDFKHLYGAISNNESPFTHQHHHPLAAIIEECGSISKVVLCNVAPQSVENTWRQWLMTHLPQVGISNFDSSLKYSKIQNHYQNPNDLGNDRWAAIIGGSFYSPNGNYLVVNSGTATTIDYVNEALQFEGGLILPGINLMLTALGSKTALLSDLSYQSRYDVQQHSLGNSTDSAILQGVLYSQLGAIQMALSLNPKIRHLILSGGNAALLANHLDTKIVKNCAIILDPYLVFRGMALRLNDDQN